jgi:hypothetical protein
VADDANPLENILRDHAVRFRGAPYASRVAQLARTAASIPEPLIADLAVLILQLDDVQLVGGDIALHLIEVGFCDVRYTDAVDFAAALRSRLRRYIRKPREVRVPRGPSSRRAPRGGAWPWARI